MGSRNRVYYPDLSEIVRKTRSPEYLDRIISSRPRRTRACASPILDDYFNAMAYALGELYEKPFEPPSPLVYSAIHFCMDVLESYRCQATQTLSLLAKIPQDQVFAQEAAYRLRLLAKRIQAQARELHLTYKNNGPYTRYNFMRPNRYLIDCAKIDYTDPIDRISLDYYTWYQFVDWLEEYLREWLALRKKHQHLFVANRSKQQ